MNTEEAIVSVSQTLSHVESLIEQGNDLSNLQKSLESLTIGLECYFEFETEYNSCKEQGFPSIFEYISDPRTIDFRVGLKTKNLIDRLESQAFKLFGNNVDNVETFVKKICHVLLDVLIEQNDIKSVDMNLFNQVCINNDVISYMIDNIPTFEDVFSITFEKKNAGSFALDEEDDEETDYTSCRNDFSTSEGVHTIGRSENVKFPKSEVEKTKLRAKYQLKLKQLRQDPSLNAFTLSKNKIKRPNSKIEKKTCVAKKNTVYDAVDIYVRNLIVHRNRTLLKPLEDALLNDTIEIVKLIDIKSKVIIDDVDVSTLLNMQDLQDFFDLDHKLIQINNKKIELKFDSMLARLHAYTYEAVKAKCYAVLLEKTNPTSKHLQEFHQNFENSLVYIESEIKTIRYNLDRVVGALITPSVNSKIVEKAKQYETELEIILRIRDINKYFYGMDRNIKLEIFNSDSTPNDFIHFIPEAINICQLIINSVKEIKELDSYKKFINKYEFVEVLRQITEDVPVNVPINPKDYNIDGDLPIMVKPTKQGNFIYELVRMSHPKMQRPMSQYYFDKLNFIQKTFEDKLESLTKEFNHYFPEMEIKQNTKTLNSKRDYDLYDSYNLQLTNKNFYHDHLSIGYILSRYTSSKKSSAPIINQDRTKLVNKDIYFAFKNNFNVFEDFITNAKKYIDIIANKSIVSVISSDIKYLENMISIYKQMEIGA